MLCKAEWKPINTATLRAEAFGLRFGLLVTDCHRLSQMVVTKIRATRQIGCDMDGFPLGEINIHTYAHRNHFDGYAKVIELFIFFS